MVRVDRVRSSSTRGYLQLATSFSGVLRWNRGLGPNEKGNLQTKWLRGGEGWPCAVG